MRQNAKKVLLILLAPCSGCHWSLHQTYQKWFIMVITIRGEEAVPASLERLSNYFISCYTL